MQKERGRKRERERLIEVHSRTKVFSALNKEQFYPLGDTWQSQETFCSERVLVACGRKRTKMIHNILHCTTKNHPVQAQMSVLRLSNLSYNENET